MTREFSTLNLEHLFIFFFWFLPFLCQTFSISKSSKKNLENLSISNISLSRTFFYLGHFPISFSISDIFLSWINSLDKKSLLYFQSFKEMLFRLKGFATLHINTLKCQIMFLLAVDFYAQNNGGGYKILWCVRIKTKDN